MNQASLRFATACVLALGTATFAAAAAVPAPESVLGHRPGADYKLADYETLVKYFRALDAASPRVVVRDIGPTAEGRTMIAAIITSEANQGKLDRFREISQRLALARGLDDTTARALAAEGKAVVWIDFGLHSNEVAPAQASSEIAYRVATEESEEMRRIRDDVIFILVPVMNPDGLDKICAWYKRNLGTPYEVSPMVELYHKYVGHDNNRDWYMFNMPESRNVAKLLYSEWFPQIVYNQHQTAPFPARIFVPPFADPMNPNIPPQVMRGVATVGDSITSRLEAEGKVGAISRMSFDTWWNGGMRTAPYFHNMVGILTETALWRYATPYNYDPAKLPKKFRDGTTPTDSPTSAYPSPWRGGWWRLRDAVDYIITASMATLDVGSERRSDWLYGMYLMGKAAIDAGTNGGPSAYVIPKAQRDPGAAARLIDALRIGGVEVKRAAKPFRAGDKDYEDGSYVVPMAQPFRAYAKDLLETQKYPDRRQSANGPPIPPYDITGWTLPAQMGVEGVMVEKPFEASLEPLTSRTSSSGRIEGEGSWIVADAAWNDSFVLANRVWKAGGSVARATAAFNVGSREFAPGAFVFDAGANRSLFEGFASERSVSLTAASSAPSVAKTALRAPRVGLYKPWIASMDEGWTRFVLEQHEFPYTTLVDADVRAGNLGERFDVIVLADSSTSQLLHGNPPGTVPPEFTSGLTVAGAGALQEFVRSGGTLVTLDSASDLPLDVFGLGVRNALKGVPRSEYFCPGGLLRAQADPSDPLTYGVPKDFVAFVENGPAFDVGMESDDEGEESPALAPLPGGPPRIVARFAETSVLHSGWLLGEAKIAKKGILVEAPYGSGRVVLVGFRSQFRGQSLATFKVLFNALLAHSR
jgi:hypothetical protein